MKKNHCSNLYESIICFVGAGSMAQAIIRGLIEQGVADPANIRAVNHSDAGRLQDLSANYGIMTASDAGTKAAYIREANIVVLAVKPKDIAQTAAELKPLLNRNQLLISVVAGLRISTITEFIGQQLPIVRMMPNTSSTIGLGATGMSFGETVSGEQQQLARTMFEAIGIVCAVEESSLDIVTGVSGSGPAYVYYFMEAMIRAGIQGGLSPDAAKLLTVQTVLGAARMVDVTNEDPESLRHKVTSPGGTTQAAIEVLNANKFSDTIIEAIHRASERAGELGEQLKPYNGRRNK